jgi:hypothetical protein
LEAEHKAAEPIFRGDVGSAERGGKLLRPSYGQSKKVYFYHQEATLSKRTIDIVVIILGDILLVLPALFS